MMFNGNKIKIILILTRIYLENDLFEINICERRLFGWVLNSDLKFHRYIEVIIKKPMQECWFYTRKYSFNVSLEDFIHIYIEYSWSLVEEDVAVWNHPKKTVFLSKLLFDKMIIIKMLSFQIFSILFFNSENNIFIF